MRDWATGALLGMTQPDNKAIDFDSVGSVKNPRLFTISPRRWRFNDVLPMSVWAQAL